MNWIETPGGVAAALNRYDRVYNPPPVKRRCKICEMVAGGGEQWPEPERGVISPARIEHIGFDWGDTACGHDATGDGWWWPL